MLLSLPRLNPSPPQTTKPFSPIYFPFPNTLIFQNHKTPSKSSVTIHCSTSKTAPHSAIQRIADKLRSLGFTEQNPKPQTPETKQQREGEIFIPLPNQLSKYRVGHTLDPSWSTPENPVPRPGSGNAIVRYHELRKEVKKEREAKKGEPKVPTLAELSLSKEELRRLRRIGIEEKRKLKVGKAGITEGIVNGIHERWRRFEVVKIVCEDLCKMNMKRTHDLLERKTGGLIVWRAGSKIVLYRGINYKYPYFLSDNTTANRTSTDAVKNINEHNEGDETKSCSSGADGTKFSGPSPTNKTGRPALIQGVGLPNRVRFQLPGEAQLAEEVDSLLEGLGPRFDDWWGYEPLPVDADLLPAIVPGYQKPFRLLPYGVKPILTNDEMTTLKRLGRPLPCHFALGRNRKLQGLAASIVKLWERCEIAKIAIKRGVQNTNSEMMAKELKWLTGGTLLSRDREFIVLYRGKDFLPSAVSSAIKERRNHAFNVDKETRDHSISGETTKEVEDVKDGTRKHGSRDEIRGNNDQSYDLSKQRKLSYTEEAIKRTSIRLSTALEKKAKAEKLLEEIENSQVPQKPEIDKEGITEEERYMLRKIGLKMKPFLLMGRRGVFDGTIENMHLHWKYRELVKIICKERSLDVVHEVAQSLEAESGGILVAVEKVSKGYAIVIYRGKNYKRPDRLRPPTLLSKREAMKRSLEAQRRESLKLHVLKLTRNANDLKLKLAKDEEAHKMQSFEEIKGEMHRMASAIDMRSDSELNSDNHSFSVFPSRCKDNVENGGEHEADFKIVNSNDGLNASLTSIQPHETTNQTNPCQLFDGNGIGRNEPESLPGPLGKETNASVNSIQFDEQTSQTNPSLHDGIGIGKTEPECSSEPVSEETHASLSAGINGGAVGSTSFPNTFTSEERGFYSGVSADHCVSENETMRSTAESTTAALEEPVPIFAIEDNELPSSTIHLSNRDRLTLRKQALKMKKRPVLAVGRSNIVTGVAKTIKTHFKKYPLAIVNVKGRAKGTSVQEVVFQLEQATGGVLVSQEPSKVILYRGWGAFDEPGHKGKKNAQDSGKTSEGKEGSYRLAVSPELMAAIRLECGLQNRQEHKPTPLAEN